MPIVLLAALCVAVRDSVNALRAREGHPTPFLNAWYMFAGAGAIFVFGLPFVPFPGAEFWRLAAIALPVEMALQWLFFRALTLAQSSKLLPLMGITPLMLYLVGYRELTPAGGGGIALVVGGVAVIIGGVNFCRGSLAMAGCAILCVVTNLCVASMVKGSGLMATLVWYNIATLVLLAPLALREARRHGKRFLPRSRLELTSSLLFVANLALTTYAMTLGPVAYINATKRASVVFSVFFGRRLGDDQFGRRLAGACLILVGVAVIGLFG